MALAQDHVVALEVGAAAGEAWTKIAGHHLDQRVPRRSAVPRRSRQAQPSTATSLALRCSTAAPVLDRRYQVVMPSQLSVDSDYLSSDVRREGSTRKATASAIDGLPRRATSVQLDLGDYSATRREHLGLGDAGRHRVDADAERCPNSRARALLRVSNSAAFDAPYMDRPALALMAAVEEMLTMSARACGVRSASPRLASTTSGRRSYSNTSCAVATGESWKRAS